MKKLILVLFLLTGVSMQAQDNAALVKHYENFYKQMRSQGDMQGIINAMTHLNILKPSKARTDTLAYLYANGGKYVQALNTIGIEKLASDSDLAIEVKAVSLKALKQPQRALEQYEVLFERKPNAYMAYEMADLLIQTGKTVEADEKIEYGINNSKDEDKKSFYESQVPYEVALKAAFLHLKALVQFNKDQKNNIDSAIALLNEALAISANFNLAQLSKDALIKRKNPPAENKPKN
jgi:tetratricopeptide (TPR) repeat protein